MAKSWRNPKYSTVYLNGNYTKSELLAIIRKHNWGGWR